MPVYINKYRHFLCSKFLHFTKQPNKINNKAVYLIESLKLIDDSLLFSSSILLDIYIYQE